MDEPIDFILPWVDASDTRWQKEKQQYASEIKNYSHNDHGIVRYRDTRTLKYVLRGIERNCPWYNRIVIITQGHKPDWIDDRHPKIRFITHQELYFDSSHLPTFNSSSIEMNLPNLSGKISEKFVYLNDDFLIMNPLGKERFFQKGKPVDFLMHGWIPRGKIYQVLRDGSAWVKALNNSVALINRVSLPPEKFLTPQQLFHSSYPVKSQFSNALLRYLYRRYFFIAHWHNAQPYEMNTLREVYALFKNEMIQASQNRFRFDNDLTQYLYRYYHLSQGNFIPNFYNDNYRANIVSLDSLKKIIKTINKNRPNFVSIYDNYPNEKSVQIEKRLWDFLEQKFPQKASFEH